MTDLPTAVPIRLLVNGVAVSRTVEARTHLVDFEARGAGFDDVRQASCAAVVAFAGEGKVEGYAIRRDEHGLHVRL